MQNNKTISTKNKFKGNPRRISKDQFERLKEHLKTLGDLSGVVYCHNNKAYVGGNQRSEVFNGAKIEYVKQYDIPTPQKTVAIGFVIWNNERYAYREVAFTEEEFRMACIVANNDGGEWDMDILYNEWDTDLLKDWGMDIKFPEPDEEPKSDDPIEEKPISIIIKELSGAQLIELFEELKDRGFKCELKS